MKTKNYIVKRNGLRLQQRSLLLCLMLVLIVTSYLNAQEFDLLIKGGQVIDPKNEVNTVMDIAVVDNKIAAVAPNIEASRA